MTGFQILIAYLFGIVVIGLPMAKFSLWCYKQGEKLDHHPRARLFKFIRNFLHPGSFIPFYLPEWEHYPRGNYGMNYEGMIGEVDVEDRADCLYYLTIASIFWPLRLFWSLLATLFAGVVVVTGITIVSPFLLIKWLCKLATGSSSN